MRGSEKHSAAMGVAGSVLGGLGGGRRGRSLRGGGLYWGFFLLEFWGLTRGKQGDNGAFGAAECLELEVGKGRRG